MVDRYSFTCKNFQTKFRCRRLFEAGRLLNVHHYQQCSMYILQQDIKW